MKTSIKVSVQDLLEKLQAMNDDECVIAELTIDTDEYNSASELQIGSVDVMDGDVTPYGSVPYEDGEFI